MDYQPNNVTDCISVAGIAIEKGLLLLGDLVTEYSFCNSPKADLDTANREAQKLLIEYNRLRIFMDMAHDYFFEVSRIIDRAYEIDREARRKGGASK